MSAAGTPSTDPWVILARERARYEEQFKSLKPSNGIITGEQAKGFFLQSQLPPQILGQIWALADTDADGKMDINEFSIACKLINLKLRGYEVPKGLPPSLLASLKTLSPPAIPPLPNSAGKPIGIPPPRPEPPKVAPIVNSQSLIQNQQLITNQSLLSQAPPLLPGLGGIPPTSSTGIPTGIVPPMQVNLLNNQSLISGIPSMQPISNQVSSFNTGMGSGVTTSSSNVPLIPGIQPVSGIQSHSTLPSMTVPPMPLSTLPPLSSVPPISSVQPISSVLPMSSVPPMIAGASFPNGGTVPSAVPLSNLPPLSTTATAGPVGSMSPLGAQSTAIGGPGATSTPRASVTSLERGQSIESIAQPEWAVPHQTKLKYTQIFNTTDRTRSGFLSGAQARNVMVQTKLPQTILAQIWALSDMDADGRLGCEEFVLAMHLCEQASLGHPPPTKLPLELIPPSFRRSTRTASVSSQGSVTIDQDPASTLLQQNSFEDKRKENFEKGQAELERRRKTLLDQQRQEREERERKEREEIEKREKARQEAERKRLEELEKQMRDQQERERQMEEERKRQAEQREAARKEMERQRQLEWEKQRLQELQQQRQREQENVLKLKAKNQSLTIELSSLNDHVKELSQKICDTRLGVSNVKTTIDGMRSTRDSQMQEMSQLKTKLKEQNAKLLALSQEKIKLEAKNKLNAQDSEQARVAFENKEINIKNLKQKIDDMEQEINGKMTDIENNNSILKELQNEMKNLVTECENLYNVYEQKRSTVLEMKNANKGNDLDAWKTADGWGDSDGTNWSRDRDDWSGDRDDWSGDRDVSNWSGDNWSTNASASTEKTPVAASDMIKYRALYEFVARNNDEISFQPGDIINVPTQQTGEPGWLAGEIRGKTGWFPESYVEPVDGVGVRDNLYNEPVYAETTEAQRLEGIAELPEGTETNNSIEPVPAQEVTNIEEGDAEYYIANYTYISQEPGDLTFNAGEVVTVLKKDGDWWTGKLKNNVGIFPSNYVQKLDVNSSSAATAASTTNEVLSAEPAPATPPVSTGVSAEAVQSALENSSAQADNEVSQINQSKPKDFPPLDANIQANAQAVKVKKPEIAQVIAPYQSTSPEQLSLARGQLIMIRKKADSGWWEGELQAKGRKRQVGWFPASYVKVLNSSGRTSGRTTPVSTSRMQQEIVIDKVIALYPYTALNPDELTFEKDDIISVTAREEESWWRGELNGVCGLFPSNYVAPLTQQYYSPEIIVQGRKRQESIKEFIQTERIYVKDMSIVREVFEIPLRLSKLIPSKDIDEIFVNWQDIIQCNKNFLRELIRSYDAGRDMVGDIICRHLPRMTAYITFCKKQLDSAALLQNLTENSTAFRELVKRCQRNVATKGMPLSSFLIKPMQRITRYPLFISKILESTPVDHPDYTYLEEALKVAEKFLNCVNENVRIKENQDRLDWLQQCVQNDLNLVFNSHTNKLGPRQLLHHSVLRKLKTNKELIGFLFNDFFLLVQPSKSVGTQFNFQRNTNITYKMYKQPIFTQYLVISRDSTDHVEHGTDSNRVINLHDEKTSYKIALLATTVHECSLLMKRIESAKDAYKKTEILHQQNKRKSLPFSRKHLRVTVEEGREIMRICNPQTCLHARKKGKSHSENIYVKVMLGSQEQETNSVRETFANGNAIQNGAPPIPLLVWNYNMQFQLRNINQEILTFVVQEQNQFGPDEFLGRAEIKLSDIFRESQHHKGPITRKLILHQVESGELLVKFDLQIFNNY